MKVIVAKTAGFCFGVKRAVDKVYQQINDSNGEKIYTYGPIIHNEEVVKDLEKKGVEIINSKEELKNIKRGTIVIRSHGVDKEVYDIAHANGLKIEDATCPFVLKIHKIVEKEKNNGRHIVIIGNKDHPEVQGIRGWSGDDTTIIGDEEEARKFELKDGSKICIVSQTTFNYNKFQELVEFIEDNKNKLKKICIVSQTTFNYNKFKYLVEIISKKRYDINVLDTICNATHERQSEAKEIAANVDSMIVIGGKKSSNTQKLYEICSKECKNTYYIQTLEDMDLCELQSSSCVGITAGASTPNNIIEEVHTNVRKF